MRSKECVRFIDPAKDWQVKQFCGGFNGKLSNGDLE